MATPQDEASAADKKSEKCALVSEAAGGQFCAAWSDERESTFRRYNADVSAGTNTEEIDENEQELLGWCACAPCFWIGGGRSSLGAAAEAEHSRDHGGRHRLLEHQRLQPRHDGLPHASPLENKGVELDATVNAAYFLEGEEWNEGHAHDYRNGQDSGRRSAT